MAEANHDTPSGTLVATLEIEDRICRLQGIGKDGTPGPVERLEVDHLGAKYYDPKSDGSQSIYVLIVENWKRYPASVIWWMSRKFR